MKNRWIAAFIAAAFGIWLGLTVSRNDSGRGRTLQARTEQREQQIEEVCQIDETELYAGVTELLYDDMEKVDPKVVDAAAMLEAQTLTDAKVYSFLQGPKSWEEQRDWAGEWSGYYVKGHTFGGFGCGMCCMANIYSTLSQYECSPLDMFQEATKATNYYPSKDSGAIGWEDMQTTLSASGISCKLKRKPDTYEKFKKQMEENPTMIVLVSSNYDDTFWKNTSGHYVNIWNYEEKTEDVFLAEPGDPENNRTRIPLHYVYDALKEISEYQYLLVKEYKEEKNTWKHNGITDNWVRPQ